MQLASALLILTPTILCLAVASPTSLHPMESEDSAEDDVEAALPSPTPSSSSSHQSVTHNPPSAPPPTAATPPTWGFSQSLQLNPVFPTFPTLYVSPQGHLTSSPSATNFAAGALNAFPAGGYSFPSPSSQESRGSSSATNLAAVSFPSGGFSFSNPIQTAAGKQQSSATNFAEHFSNGVFSFSNPTLAASNNDVQGFGSDIYSPSSLTFSSYSFPKTYLQASATNHNASTNHAPPHNTASIAPKVLSGGYTFPGTVSAAPLLSYPPLYGASASLGGYGRVGHGDAFGAYSAALASPTHTVPRALLQHGRIPAAGPPHRLATGPHSTAPVTFAPAAGSSPGPGPAPAVQQGLRYPGAPGGRGLHFGTPSIAPTLRLHSPTATLYHRQPTFLGHVNGVPSWSFPLHSASATLRPFGHGPQIQGGFRPMHAPITVPPPSPTPSRAPTPPKVTESSANESSSHEDSHDEDDEDEEEDEDEREDLREHERDHEELRQRLREQFGKDDGERESSEESRGSRGKGSYYSSSGNKIPYGSKTYGGNGRAPAYYKSSYSTSRHPNGGRHQHHDDRSGSRFRGSYDDESSGPRGSASSDCGSEEGFASFGPFRLPTSLKDGGHEGAATAPRARPPSGGGGRGFEGFSEAFGDFLAEPSSSSQGRHRDDEDRYSDPSERGSESVRTLHQYPYRAPGYSPSKPQSYFKGRPKDSQGGASETDPRKARIIEHKQSTKTIDYSLETREKDDRW